MKKSNSYWEKRAEARLTNSEYNSAKYQERIVNIYDKALKNIDKEISKIKSVAKAKSGLDNEKINELLSAKYSEQYREKLLEEINTITNKKLKKEMFAEYNAKATQARITRLEEVKSNIQLELAKVADNEILLSNKNYKSVIEDTYNRTTFDIQKGLNLNYSFAKINEDLIDKMLKTKWKGGTFSSRIWGNAKGITAKIGEKLDDAILTGISIEKLYNNLDNVFRVGKFNAMRLARTETTYFHNQAELQSYEEAGINELIFVATLDKVTSEMCREHDGQKIKLKDVKVGVNYPPLHPFCRSTTIASFDDETIAGLERRTENNKVFDKESIKEQATNENDMSVSRVRIETKEEKSGIIEESNKIIFKEAKTIDEAKQYTKKTLGINGIFDDCSIENINIINETITDIYNEFGDLSQKGTLKSIAKCPKRINAVACYSPGFKTYFYKNMKSKNALYNMTKEAKFQFEIGYWTSESGKHTIRHEVGHALFHSLNQKAKDELLIIHNNLKDTILEKEKFIFRNSNSDYSKILSDAKIIKAKGFSYYGMMNENEMTAEAIAHYMEHKEKSSEIVLKIIKTIKGE